MSKEDVSKAYDIKKSNSITEFDFFLQVENRGIEPLTS